MSNTDRHPECYMRTVLGNCDPRGGFCTSVNEPICEALHKISRPQGYWIEKPKGFGLIANVCSICGVERAWKTNFCENCGADMRGEIDG